MSLLVVSNMSLPAETQNKHTTNYHEDIGNDIENNPRCTNCKYASKPLVPTLRFPAGSLRALLTGTWACSKMDLFIDGGHRNNDSKKRQHTNNALILCGTNDQRGISYSDSTTFWNGHVTCFIKRASSIIPSSLLPSSLRVPGIQTVWVDPSVKHTWEAALLNVQIPEWMVQKCAT